MITESSIELGPLDKETAQKNLNSGNIKVMVTTLLSLALYSSERDWVDEVCKMYLDHSNIDVKSTAIISIAHIARLDKHFDLDLIPVFKEYLRDPEISGRVQDAIDDICIFTQLDESLFLS